ncbi:hypothetical protein [Maritalea porphyrae]|uniref:hypothetical protein n=1 Tax=Maritalea porphyrae TaxID=880732 RepID=UPI0022AF5C37|nr:hypothetical protein [Maritalea porphyrae]MCZ4270735.1 hypothetical protein [Maritalea porphyrae]
MTYTLIIIMHFASGHFTETALHQHLSLEECIHLERQIWDLDYPVVYEDEAGPAWSLDAACIPIKD